jgi:virulence-associated protein VapD
MEKKKPVDNLKIDTLNLEAIKSASKQPQMFSNPIDNAASFGVSRELTDSLNRVLDDLNPLQASKSFARNGKTYQTTDNKVAVRLADTKNLIINEQTFYHELEKIKSGKSLQTMLALWDFANQQGSFTFNGTKIDQIMRAVLKPTSTGYYTQQQKRDFTAAVHQLRDIELSLDNPVTITEKGKKKQAVKRDYFRLVDLHGAVYAKTRGEKEGEWVVDESVIVKIYGELLPRFNKGIMRGRLQSRGILELDANKDEKAILLGFRLLVRFDQIRMGKKGSQNSVSEENLFIRLTRKKLIEMAEYQQTDAANKSVASQQLKNTLNKLVDVHCLRDYDPQEIGTDDSQHICLFPYPIAIQLEKPEKTRELDEPSQIKLLRKCLKSTGRDATAEWLSISVEQLDSALKGEYQLGEDMLIKLETNYGN